MKSEYSNISRTERRRGGSYKYSKGSRNDDSSRRLTEEQKKLIICLAAAVLITALCDIVFSMLAFYGLPEGSNSELWLRTVLLPMSSFVAAFFSLLATKNMIASAISSAGVHIFTFLIAVSLNFSVLLWNLLYIFSALIGLVIAYIALTHKDE